MADEPTLLNIDIDFTNKPTLSGNQYITQNFVGSSDIRRIQPYMDVNDINVPAIGSPLSSLTYPPTLP